ncbi:MAG TPA: hypothetical protein VFV39_00225, partial [Limnobacter sp.]|nr:hypothetical protein [Limnobacter sp.]
MQQWVGFHQQGFWRIFNWQSRQGIVYLACMLLSLFAWASFSSLSVSDDEHSRSIALAFSSQQDSPATRSLFDVLESLQRAPVAHTLRTQLNEQPFWTLTDLSQQNLAEHGFLSFRSRHWVDSSCWRQSGDGSLEELVLLTDHGRRLMVDLRTLPDTRAVLCQFRFVGPATLQIGLQTRESYEANTVMLERRQGYLEGVLYLMIGLVAVAALMTGNILFLCYGFWLFASLRLVAMQEGWDHTFIGFELSASALVHSRMVALAMY